MRRHLSAKEAAKQLGVSVTTLYAYVSRGLVRSESVPGTRKRRYLAADVNLLKQRRQLRRDPARAARQVLHFGGLPVLESALTLIDDGHVFYRGHEVAAWAERASLEETAALLWQAPFPDETPSSQELAWSDLKRELSRLPRADAFQMYLAVAAAMDPAAFDLRPEGVRRAGARILRGLAGVTASMRPTAEPVATTLRRGWRLRSDKAEKMISSTLVLCADHELNSSAFTARCVASSGSSPYAAVTGALASLQGYKHGGHTELVAALFRELLEGRDPRALFAAALRQGKPVPGFGHPLYPEGDPRGRALLKLVRAYRPRSRTWAAVERACRAARTLLGEQPNLDFGLVAVCRVLDLPVHAPFSLFALGRTVGWIAHALEQYGTDRMIRPRARYVGPDPAEVAG